MSERDDGGSAFPRPGFYHVDSPSAIDNIGTEGMSLRDWFAGRFAAAIITGTFGRFNDDTPSAYKTGPCNSVVTDRAYVLADAMLEQRKK